MPGENFDIKITIKKYFTGLLMTIVPAILLYSVTFVEGSDFPEEYILYVPLIVAMLHAVLNAFKHWND